MTAILTERAEEVGRVVLEHRDAVAAYKEAIELARNIGTLMHYATTGPDTAWKCEGGKATVLPYGDRCVEFQVAGLDIEDLLGTLVTLRDRVKALQAQREALGI